MNNYLVGIEGMKAILKDVTAPADSFKKKTYTGNFEKIYRYLVPTMDAIEAVYNSVKEPEILVQNMAQALVDTAVEKMNACTKKSQKENAIDPQP